MKASIKETELETAQRGLDKSILLLSDSKVSSAVEALELVPGARVITAGYKVMSYYKSRRYIKKVLGFLQALETGLDEQKLEKLYKKYGREKVVEEIVCQLDSFSDIEKGSVFGHLLRACTERQITFDEFKTLSFALDQLNPSALDTEIKFANGENGELISSSTGFLIAVGLANSYSKDQPFTWSGGTGGTHYSITPLGMKMVKFGIWPHQAKQSSAGNE